MWYFFLLNFDKADDTCPMRVSFNAHSVFVATIGKHSNLLHRDEMKTTLKLEAIDIEQT